MAVPVSKLVSQRQREPLTSDGSPALSPAAQSNDKLRRRIRAGLLYALPLSAAFWLLIVFLFLGILD
jgi:hypothetical protein